MTYIEMFILLFTQLTAAVNLFAGTVQHVRIKAIPAASNSKNCKQRAKQEMRLVRKYRERRVWYCLTEKRNAKGTRCELCTI
jgi:hypothetical protein